MTPSGGGSGEVVFAQPGSGNGTGGISVKFGPLPPGLKSFSGSASKDFLAGLTSLNATKDLSEGLAGLADGTMTLSFMRSYSPMPSALYLNYAHGNAPEVAYHVTRGCFTVQTKGLPVCGALSTSALGAAAPAPAQPLAQSNKTCPVCKECPKSSLAPAPRRMISAVALAALAALVLL
jgi:hypothetical protein